MNARTLEVLEDLDVARRLVKEGIQAPRFTIRDRDRTLIPIDFSGLPTEYPYSLMVPQCDDREAAAGSAGRTRRQRACGRKTLASVAQDADGVTATLDDGDTHAGALRRRRRRHAQHRARAGGHRVPGRRVRRVVRAGRRPADAARRPTTRSSCSGRGGPDGGGAAARRRLPDRRAAAPTRPRRRPRSSSSSCSTIAGRRRAASR